jgi:predicted nucleic acid-binding protein
MQKITFDTNAFESDNFLPFPNADIYVSAIVLMELMTACYDKKELKNYQKLWLDAKKKNLLIVPSEQDIFEASRIQFLLAQDRKDAKGNSTKRPAKIKQEIALDCLIAASSSRQKVAVVTNDGDYFEIKRYLKNLKLISL